ncbi:MAG: hypothetical protein ACE5HT_03130 [Gemmatimonadales bacterium]
MTRRISARPEVQYQLNKLEAPASVRLLAQPNLGYSEGSVVVSYTLAFFEPGSVELAMPDLELIDQDGIVEHVSGGTALVTVRSVLPQEDSALGAKPSLGPFVRASKRPEYLGITVLLAVAGLVTWTSLRRRRARRPVQSVAVPGEIEVPLLEWARAGESRAVAAATSDRLRHRIAQRFPDAGRDLTTEQCLAAIEIGRPDWPVRDIADTLRDLDRARFAPAISHDVLDLVERAEALHAVLSEAHLASA